MRKIVLITIFLLIVPGTDHAFCDLSPRHTGLRGQSPNPSTSLRASNGDSPLPVPLEPITVTGQSKEPALESTSSATVITESDLKNREGDLNEVLSETAGIQTKRYGGLQDFSAISIRGSTAEQVQVFVDGVPLNPASGGGANLSSIPVEAIERIEVYRGAAPAWFDTSAIGGVVSITTKKAKEKPKTTVSSSYGSFNTYHGGVFQSYKSGPYDHVLQYDYQRSGGDFGYLDDNGTPLNPNDDQTRNRQNNEFAKHNLLTKFGFFPNDQWNFNFSNQFLREDRGIPGLGNLTSLTADLSTTRNQTSIEASKKDTFTSNDSLSIQPFFTFQKQQFSDPASEIGLGAQDNDDDTLGYGSPIRYRFTWGPQSITTLASYRGEQFLPENFLATPTTGAKSYRNTAAVGVDDEIFFFGEKLLINPGMRMEGIFNNFSGSDPSFAAAVTANTQSYYPVSGKLGVRWAIDNHWTAKTQFNRSYRIPNFTELFGDRGTLQGNSSLNPEDAYNWDAGIKWQIDFISIEGIYFLNHTNNLIQFLQTSQLTARATNLSKARIMGMEWIVSMLPWKHLKLSANYTYQQPTDISGLAATDGKTLPGRPIHDLHTEATLFNSFSKLFASFDFMDDNYLDTQNLLRVDNRSYLNTGVSATWRWLTATLEIKNILGDRTVDVIGFPLPGRSYFGRIDITI